MYTMQKPESAGLLTCVNAQEGSVVTQVLWQVAC
jgi:hypothetical protein